MNTEDLHTVLEVARRVEPVAELTFRIAAKLEDAVGTESRAAHAEEAVANDEDRPALADELERASDRAVLKLVVLP
jgi:hypothetical protein